MINGLKAKLIQSPVDRLLNISIALEHSYAVSAGVIADIHRSHRVHSEVTQRICSRLRYGIVTVGILGVYSLCLVTLKYGVTLVSFMHTLRSSHNFDFI